MPILFDSPLSRKQFLRRSLQLTGALTVFGTSYQWLEASNKPTAVHVALLADTHVYRYGQKEHIQLINLPAVGYNFSDNQPVGWIEAWIDKEKGQFKLHAIGGNTEKNGITEEVIWN